jgi:hypothetical protein
MDNMKFIAYKTFKNFDEISGGLTLPFTLGNLQDREDFDFEDGCYVGWDELGLENPNTKVMQYTGCNDCDNNEIYNDFIIEYTITHIRYRIMFEHGRYKAIFIPYGKFVGGYSIDTIHNLDFKFYRIIGNIHANPELLSGDTSE